MVLVVLGVTSARLENLRHEFVSVRVCILSISRSRHRQINVLGRLFAIRCVNNVLVTPSLLRLSVEHLGLAFMGQELLPL